MRGWVWNISRLLSLLAWHWCYRFRTGVWYNVAPQANLSVSILFLKMYLQHSVFQVCIILICHRRTPKTCVSNKILSFKPHQTLWLVNHCDISFTFYLSKVHQISREGYASISSLSLSLSLSLSFFFLFGKMSIILQEDDVWWQIYCYILGTYNPQLSSYFTLKFTLIPPTKIAQSPLAMAIPRIFRYKWVSLSIAAAPWYQGNFRLYLAI